VTVREVKGEASQTRAWLVQRCTFVARLLAWSADAMDGFGVWIRTLVATATATGGLVLFAQPASAVTVCSSTGTFNFTGGEQCYTVPAGVASLYVVANGAPGSTGTSPATAAGGKGAHVEGRISVSPFQQLFVYVGGAGGIPGGGYNGGGSGANNRGGGGGGASDVRTASGSLGTRVLVAGGGGGAGAAGTEIGPGGFGGGDSTMNGAQGASLVAGPYTWQGGFGGTQSAGGAGGTNGGGCTVPTSGTSGSAGSGGTGGTSPLGTGGAGGGGGGGGLYGGGGGAGYCNANGYGAGGGGGSSFSSDPNAIFTTDSTSTPKVVIRLATTASGQTKNASTGQNWAGQAAGSQAYETATIGGQVAPFVAAGTVTYELFSNSTCAGSPLTTQTVTLNANGTVPSANTTSALDAGAHAYRITYSGDSSFGPATACDAFTVQKAQPTFSISAGDYELGGQMQPSFTLSGSYPTPGVTYVTLRVYKDAPCSGSPLYEQNGGIVNEAGSGPPFKATSAGTYYVTGQYSGDANNAATAELCDTDHVAKFVVGDTIPPVVGLTAPINGWISQGSLTLAGVGGTAPGDKTRIDIELYDGTSVSGSPFSSVVTFLDSNGVYAVGIGLDDGTFTLRAKQSDDAGNVGYSNSVTVTIDSRPPSTTDDVPTGWVAGARAIHLSASDARTGVDKTYYTTDGSTPVTSSSVYDPAHPPTLTNGQSIKYFSVDKAGNAETVKTGGPLIVDARPPDVLDDVDGAAPWVNHDIEAMITAADIESGVDKVYYTPDGSTPTTSSSVYDSASKPTLGEGGVVKYFATDRVGNASAVVTSATARVDKTKPSTSDDVPSTWQSQPVEVTLTPSDSRSGVAATYYTTDGSTPDTSSSVYDSGNKPLLGDGETIKYFSVDNAGNAESVQTSRGAHVDQLAPATSDNVPTTWSGNDVTVTLTTSDAGSGVDKTYYGVGSDPVTSVYDPADKPVLGDGDTISYYSVDQLGNAETVKTSPAAKVDTTAPSTSDDVPPAWVNHDVAVTLSPSDSQSGVDKTYYGVGGAPVTSIYDPASKPVLHDGEKISYYTVDAVGNSESVKTSPAAQVDKVAPASNATAPAAVRSTAIHVDVSAADAASGVDAVDLYVKRPGDASYAKVATTTGDHVDYTADAGDGDYAFYTRARDEAGNTEDAPASADATTNVDLVPDPHAADDNATTPEDTALTGNVLTNDNEATKATLVSDVAHGAVTLNADGSFTYTPAANYNGPDSFTYKASNSKHESATAKVTITVTPVDDAPVPIDDAITVAQDSAATRIDVLANDTDVDGGPKTVESVDQPAHGTVGDGPSYKPAAGYCNTRAGDSPDTFRYRLNGGASATVSVTVTCAPRTDPAPTPVARVRIAHREIVAGKRSAPLRLTCKGDAGATCAGSLWFQPTSLPDRLTGAGAKMKFSVPAGTSKRVRVKLPASTVVRLKKRHKAVVRATVLTSVGRRSTRLLTLVTQ
jgi:hypothetical protein